MRGIFTALAMAASLNAMANDAHHRASMELALQANNCMSVVDDGQSRRVIRLAALNASPTAAIALAENGITVCMDNRLKGVQLADGRAVVASLHLADRSVSLNTNEEPDEALELAGKALVEALQQIRRRGGLAPPAHMLLPLAVVRDDNAVNGFTLVPNETNLHKAVCGTPVMRMPQIKLADCKAD